MGRTGSPVRRCGVIVALMLGKVSSCSRIVEPGCQPLHAHGATVPVLLSQVLRVTRRYSPAGTSRPMPDALPRSAGLWRVPRPGSAVHTRAGRTSAHRTER